MQWLRRSLSKLIPSAPAPSWFINATVTGRVASANPAQSQQPKRGAEVPKTNGATMKVGDHVRTNARYAKEISKVPRQGILLKSLTWTAGGWIVRLEGFVKPQYVHKRYMEVTDGRRK